MKSAKAGSMPMAKPDPLPQQSLPLPIRSRSRRTSATVNRAATCGVSTRAAQLQVRCVIASRAAIRFLKVQGQGFRARPLRGPLRSFPNLAQGCQSPTLDKGSRAAKRRLAASALASLAQQIAADAAPRGPRSFAPSLPLKRLPPRTTDEIAEAVNFVAFRVPANPLLPFQPHRSRGPGKQRTSALLRRRNGRINP